MKSFELSTKKIYFREFNSIRNKKDTILLLLETIEKLLVYSEEIKEFSDFEVVKTEEDLRIVIYINKMKRLFYCTKNKIQSLCFPFTIISNENSVEFLHEKYLLDYSKISILKGVFKRSSMTTLTELNDELLVDDYYNSLCENEKEIIKQVLLFLTIFEDGYLRFDFHDTENFNEDFHPLHHIDLYYTNSNTFKLGLEEEMSLKKNIKIIDITEKCFNIK